MKYLLFLTAILTFASPLCSQSANDAYNPDANAFVQKVAIQGNGMVLIGGGFSSVGGTTRNRLARLFYNGVVDGTYNPDVNGNITALVVLPNQKVLISGGFNSVGGESRTNFAQLNADGTPDAVFTAPNAPVRAFVVQDRKSTRLNSSHGYISYAVFCLKKKSRQRNISLARLINRDLV